MKATTRPAVRFARAASRRERRRSPLLAVLVILLAIIETVPASIGGAGTFDGIFLTGLGAAIIATLA